MEKCLISVAFREMQTETMIDTTAHPLDQLRGKTVTIITNTDWAA